MTTSSVQALELAIDWFATDDLFDLINCSRASDIANVTRFFPAAPSPALENAHRLWNAAASSWASHLRTQVWYAPSK
jgi:hypothetical protein